MDNNDSTHFGFQTVKASEKAQKVANVFRSVASRYDLMNDLMSGGVHRLWKQVTIEMAAAREGQKILDLAGGTGDLSYKFSRIVGEEGLVVLADINDAMLRVGRDKLIDRGAASNLRYSQADAQYLPYADNTFDCITIAFGLRNVTDKSLALKSMLRVLKPGGRLLVLEFSKPQYEWLEKIYDQYSFRALPFMGKIVANDAESYRYLAESIRMHPDQESLKALMEEAGFAQVSYQNMTGGIVALHKGFKV